MMLTPAILESFLSNKPENILCNQRAASLNYFSLCHWQVFLKNYYIFLHNSPLRSRQAAFSPIHYSKCSLWLSYLNLYFLCPNDFKMPVHGRAGEMVCFELWWMKDGFSIVTLVNIDNALPPEQLDLLELLARWILQPSLLVHRGPRLACWWTETFFFTDWHTFAEEM